jgi:hypothetical protein
VGHIVSGRANQADHRASSGRPDRVVPCPTRWAWLEAQARTGASLGPTRSDMLHVGPCLCRVILIMLRADPDSPTQMAWYSHCSRYFKYSTFCGEFIGLVEKSSYLYCTLVILISLSNIDGWHQLACSSVYDCCSFIAFYDDSGYWV